MKVILENATAEIVEKKSRFIANIFYINNIEEADNKLNEIRKKYYTAKHNCYAYIIGLNGEIVKSSDDGEPSGTAGHPMLDILKCEEFINCIAIVTRYFGGILLGTGGLVRAYSDSLKNAINNSKTAYVKCAFEENIVITYEEYGKINNIIKNYNIENCDIIELESKFEENIKIKLLIDNNIFDKFAKDILNILKGKIILAKNKCIYYYLHNKNVIYI